MTNLIDHVRRTVMGDGGGLEDGELLGCFVERHDEAAIAALVRRHGPMVWGVCRRMLTCHQDAEDAFQATFLVLVRKSASVVPRSMVGNWLYGVAHQTAMQARRTAARRRGREVQVTVMPNPGTVQNDDLSDMQALLDQELSRLPDKYRAVIVLCELEGRTRTEVANQLGVPEGTVAGRLARARAMLAKRLTRRAVTLSVGMLAAALQHQAATANVPTSVVFSTIKAASLFAAGRAATTGAISATVAALTEGVLKTMLVVKLKNMVTTLLVAAIIGLGAGLTSYSMAVGQQGEGNKYDANAPTKEEGKSKAQKDVAAMQGTWYVTAMEDDGTPQPKDRFEDVKMRLVVKGEKLDIVTTTPDGRDVGQHGLTITLDEKASPKRLDASKDGMTLPGIYAFEKGQLRICIDLRGASRPESFETTKGSGQRSYVLKKKEAPAK